MPCHLKGLYYRCFQSFDILNNDTKHTTLYPCYFIPVQIFSFFLSLSLFSFKDFIQLGAAMSLYNISALPALGRAPKEAIEKDIRVPE